MEIRVDELLDKVSGHVKSIANTDTILGDEFTMGEYTCRPVIKVGTGFGSGTGTGDDPKRKSSGTGTGAAAGIGVTPVGFLVAKGDEISFVPSNRTAGLGTLLEKVPDLLEKVVDMKNKKEGEAGEKKEEKKEKKG
jgi:uncharacterized spore protein YtfJ